MKHTTVRMHQSSLPPLEVRERCSEAQTPPRPSNQPSNRTRTHPPAPTHTHTHTTRAQHTYLRSPMLVTAHGAQQAIVRAEAQRRHSPPVGNEVRRALAIATAAAATACAASAPPAGAAEGGGVPQANDAVPACSDTRGVCGKVGWVLAMQKMTSIFFGVFPDSRKRRFEKQCRSG